MKKFGKAKVIALLLTLALLVAAIPLILLPTRAEIAATEGWYSDSKTAFTIGNASDLWAFATALEGGKTFEGKTVYLNADITVNDDWDAFGTKTNAVQWPLTTQNKHFAGTFDGQGHTISGLYAVSTGNNGFGLFGDVPTGKTATVKNLTIVNSRIVNEDGGATGGIFGEVETESSSLILDDYHVNKTRAVISNVRLDVNVVAKGQHSESTGKSGGVGGFIGRCRTDATITNSTFDGRVTSASRGVAAFVGATYPLQISYDHDGDGATKAFYPNDTNGDGAYNSQDTAVYYKNNDSSAAQLGTANIRAEAYKTYIVIANCSADGVLDVSRKGTGDESKAGPLRFAGALVGYSNSCADNFEIKNVASTVELLGIDEGQNYVGYLFGGTWTSASSNRNLTTKDTQTWTYENVFYEKTVGNGVHYAGQNSADAKISGLPQDIEALGGHIERTMGQSITIKSDLSLHLFATVLDPNAKVLINGKPAAGASVGGWMNRYTIDGLLPQNMPDLVTIEITQTVGSHTFHTEKTTSIYRYCKSFFESDDATEAEKELIADLLRYGEQAQRYSDYNTSFLATKGMSLDGYGSSFSTSSIPTYMAKSGTFDANYDVNAAALMLGNSLAMYLRFYATDTSGLTMTVTINGRTSTYREADFVALGGGQYMIAHDNIGAHEMNIPLTATLKKNGTQVGQSLTYSIADYLKGFLALDDPKPDQPIVTPDVSLQPDYSEDELDAETRRMLDLISAMYTYGLSAEAYNDSTRRVVINGYTSDYAIVYDDAASAGVIALAHQLSADIADKTGVTLPVIKDTEAERINEIIIGNVDGRTVSLTELGKLVAAEQYGYRIGVVDQKIVIATKSENLLRYASERFVDALTTHGGITWSVPLDYAEVMDAPIYSASAQVTRKAYYSGNNNYTYVYSSNSASNLQGENGVYATYIADLKAAGFEEYATNTIAPNNTFGTYIKNVDGYNTVVYTMLYPNSKEMRVTYGPLGYLPSQKPISAEQVGQAATPSIILNAMKTANCGANGLSLVIQLVDGSFFLVDGGNPDQQVTTHEPIEGADLSTTAGWTSTANVQTQQAKALYDLLVKYAPEGTKPVIAGWYMTHAHVDHMGLSEKFLETYHAKIDVRMVAYNFPDFDTITLVTDKENPADAAKLVRTFEQRIHSYYPNADTWVMHAGQKAQLPGVEIEVMFTPEDYYGMSTKGTFEWINHSCSSIRMTFDGGTTLMVLGDTEYTLLQKMEKNYDDSYLESDIMQITHHGANGAYTDFYKAVDPKICLWPTSEFNWNTNENLKGNENGTGFIIYDKTTYIYANWWIRNSQWTRGDEQGDRIHYAVSNTEDHVILPEAILLDPSKPLETPFVPFK